MSVVYSESLLSELDPLELLLPDSEELLLLRREGPPDGAEPDFSRGKYVVHHLFERYLNYERFIHITPSLHCHCPPGLNCLWLLWYNPIVGR